MAPKKQTGPAIPGQPPAEPKPKAEAKPKVKAEPKADAAPKAQAKGEAKPKAEAKAAAAPKAEAKAASAPKAAAAPKAEAKAAAAPKAAAEPKGKAKVAPAAAAPAAAPAADAAAAAAAAKAAAKSKAKAAKAKAQPKAAAAPPVEEEIVDFGPESSWEGVISKKSKMATKKKDEPAAKVEEPEPVKAPTSIYKATNDALKDEDRAKQNNDRDKARDSQNQQRTLQRIAAVKEVKVEDLKIENLVALTVDMSLEVTAQISLWGRKLEKQYGVLIERPDSGKGGGKGDKGSRPAPKSLTVRGVEQDKAKACVEALKALDFSGKQVIPVSAKQAVAIMGPQQSNARKIEEDFKGVFIHSERNQVTLFGPPSKVASCLKHVQSIMPEEKDMTPSAPISIDKDRARALIGAGGKNVQKIETETGTQIKVNLSKKDEKEEEDIPATIIIKGEKDKQEKAREQINAFFKSLDVTLVEAEPDVITRLYEAMPRAGKGKGKGKGQEEASAKPQQQSKFAELRESSGLTVVRKAKGVLIVGDKKEVAKWKVVLQECMNDASNPPASVKLESEQAKIWSPERIEGLCESTGAKVVLARRQGASVLEIMGTDSEKEKATAAIEKVMAEMGCVETIENVSANGIKMLTAKYAGKVKDMEKEFDVCITLHRNTAVVKIIGAKESSAKAKEAVESALSAEDSVLTKEIEIAWDEGKVVIGRGGSTVRHIKQTTMVDDLQVEDGAETKKVILRGTEETIAAAEKMLKEVIAKSKESGGERPEGGRREGGKGEGKGEGKSYSKEERSARKGEGKGEGKAEVKFGDDQNQPKAAKVEKPRAPKVDVKLESEELFPTLGGQKEGASNGGKAAGTWGSSRSAAKWTAKSKDGASADAEAVAESFPALGGDKASD